MKRQTIPAEAFHPGEFVRDELEARKWTAADLSEKTHLRHDVIADLLSQSRDVDEPLAYALGFAFGTSWAVWLRLQKSWERWRRAQRPVPPST